jgi:hypothetical protein
MKLPSYRRIFKTDYSDEYQALVEDLAVSINYGFDTLYDALNKKLTFQDNIESTISDITVTVDENGVPLKRNTQFKLSENQTTVQGLMVLDAYETKNTDSPPPSAVFVSFIKNENFVLIKNIRGLTPGVSYTLKVLAIS